MARVTKINVGGTNYDIAHEGELKNSGFEVVTSLPTTDLFEGRQVLYQNRVWVYSNGWVSLNNPVSCPKFIYGIMSMPTEYLKAIARYVEVLDDELSQIPELLNKSLFISNNDNCVKKSDRLYELIDNETGTITVKTDIVQPVVGQTLRYTAINPSYGLSELYNRTILNTGKVTNVYSVYIYQAPINEKAIYKIEYYVYSNATGDGDLTNQDNYVWKTVFEKELKQYTEILYPAQSTIYRPIDSPYLYIYNIRVSITPTTYSGYPLRINDIDIKYFGANHQPPFYANRLINYDAVIEPTQTGETFKSIPWILQYLTQAVNWLKANNVRLSAYNTKVAALEQADSDNNTLSQSVRTDLTELSNGLAAVATSGSYNDLIDKPTFSGSYNDLTDKPNLAAVATSGSYNDLIDKPTFSGSYNDLTDKPTLATVATSGSYNDLTNTPNLATVATSGNYDDLLNTPALVFQNIGGTISLVQIPDGLIANGKLANSSMTLNDTTVNLGDTAILPWYVDYNETDYPARIRDHWLQIYRNGVWANLMYLGDILPTQVGQITSLDNLDWYNEQVSEYEVDSNTTQSILAGTTLPATLLLNCLAEQLTLNLYPISGKEYGKGSLDSLITNLQDKGFSVFVENDLDAIQQSGSDYLVRLKISKVPTAKAIIECYVAR